MVFCSKCDRSTMACCSKCDREAKEFCFDCNGLFCGRCSERLHQESDAGHLRERIVKDQVLHLIAPLADEVLILLGLCYVWMHLEVPSDYFHGGLYCGFVNTVTAAISRVEAGALSMLRSSLHEACAVEDSFWRLYADFWLRSIVTRSDSIVLLLSSLSHVLLAEVAALCLLRPIVSLTYALFMWLVHELESLLPQMKCLKELAETVKNVNIVDFVEETPPRLEDRLNVGGDLLEAWSYRFQQFIRVPAFYYERISAKLEFLSQWSMLAVFALRALCIFVGPLAMLSVVFCAVTAAVMWDLQRSESMLKRLRLKTAGVILLVALFASFQAKSTFQEHAARFQSVKPHFGASERLFWHVVTGVFYVTRDGVARVLCGLCLVAPATLGLAAVGVAITKSAEAVSGSRRL